MIDTARMFDALENAAAGFPFDPDNFVEFDAVLRLSKWPALSLNSVQLQMYVAHPRPV